MALTYPLDILADFPGWMTDFTIMWRREFSREAGGRSRPKDLGPPLWRLTAVSRSLSANELDHWRARLNALEEGVQTFRGYKLSRCYPILYPNGSWPTGGAFDGETAAVSTIGAQFKSLRLDDLPAGFQLSIGDMLSIDRGDGRSDLHEVMEPATASGSGLTGEFEIRPHLWPGVAIDDAVSVERPWCLMTIVPGSISATADPATGRGTVSFQGLEARL